ncbi:MAG TPA: TonB-dependent receptor [Caulobacteraceae bacterium]|jgi:iron complex outermembrane receptor protein
MKIHALWLGASALALAAGGVAQAQTTASSPPPRTAAPPRAGATSGDASGVAELVVTAERRTTALQKTPIAATVLTAADLTKNGVVTVDQLQFVSPSLTVNNFGQGNDFDIRGIGKGEHNTQTETGVITYRDGVATFPGYIQEEPYYDIANIEVLRGPQGTFSGQNATGGAVIVTTNNPVIGGGYDGYVLAHFGNYSDVGAEGAVNLPINDTLAARVAVFSDFRNSFYRVGGPWTGDPDPKWGAARLSLLWTPSSQLKVLWKTDYDYLYNGNYFGDAILNPLTGKVNPTSDLFSFSNNGHQAAGDAFVRSILQADYINRSGIDFRSVSSYQQGKSGWMGDIDGTDSSLPGESNFSINESVTQAIWSQEFNIISPSDKPITWVLGAYYDHADLAFPFGRFDIAVPFGGVDEELAGVNHTQTAAGFGQVSFQLPAGFQLQVGARYSAWSTFNDVNFFVPEFLAFGFNFPDRQTETGQNITGKVALNWNVNAHNFVYAFVATGAKPGGLNTPPYFGVGAGVVPPPFAQEYVTDYEGGWKSTLLDGHLQTQLGVYYNQFNHFQVILPIPNNPVQSTEINNPSATVLYGFEASAQARWGGLALNAGLGLEHSALGTFFTQDPRLAPAGTCDPAAGPATATCINLAGHPQTYAPNVTFNVSASYDVKLTDLDTLTPNVSFSYISSQWGTLFDNAAEGDFLASRHILGASLAWKHASFTTTLYGANLLDDRYVSALLSPIRLAGFPLQFGISVMKTF